MKRTAIKRTAPLAKGGRLKAISDKRAKANRIGKSAARATDYLDCQGVAFSQHHKFWKPVQVEVVRNLALLKFMHERFPFCFNCETRGAGLNTIQAHHIEAGYGRSDVRCNIAMFCAECHGKVKTDFLSHGKIYFLKWLHDPEGTDWVLLARLGGVVRLPDLICD